MLNKFEPRRKKICPRVFRPGPTQDGLYSHRMSLVASNIRFGKLGDCIIHRW